MTRTLDNIFSKTALHFIFLFLLPAVVSQSAFAQDITISDIPHNQFSIQVNQDINLLRSFTENIEKTVQVMEESRLFEKGRAKDFDIGERENFYLLWGSYLDHIVAFESLINFYKSFYLITDRENHEDAFLIAYAASLARHANSLKIIRQTIDNDLYEKILDDVNPDYGIPSGMYARLKWNTIHVQDLTGVIAGYHYYRLLERSYEKRGLTKAEETAWIFNSIQRNYDYIGVLRPKLSKLDIAKAIDEAFHYLGRPYDFNFDFITDSSIVCSELIYKAYKNGSDKKGLALSIRDIAGRKAMPANDIADKFDMEYDNPNRELEFVYFLDGIEKDNKAVLKEVSEFRASHRRMKWDIVQK